jgi:hypothetical protein
MKRSRLTAVVSLTLVFISGVVLGAFGHRVYRMNSVMARSGGPEEYRRKMVEEMRSRLNLTTEQVTGLEKVLDETRQRYREYHERHKPERKAIQDQQVQEISAMLNETQRVEYEKIREERRKQRQAKEQAEKQGAKR